MLRMIVPKDEFKRILRKRRRCLGDRKDEVWNGVYVMAPVSDNEHQLVMSRLLRAIDLSLGEGEDATVYPGVNVSDQPERWKTNYRCPDVAVYYRDNPAQDCGSHYLGGPDFAVEIVTPEDRSRKKFPFYASVGVRELLLVDRYPWSLELRRLRGDRLEIVGTSKVDQPDTLASTVLPLTFRLIAGDTRPRLEAKRPEDGRIWLI
jgi:Uma2 family endonuclease